MKFKIVANLMRRLLDSALDGPPKPKAPPGTHAYVLEQLQTEGIYLRVITKKEEVKKYRPNTTLFSPATFAHGEREIALFEENRGHVALIYSSDTPLGNWGPSNLFSNTLESLFQHLSPEVQDELMAMGESIKDPQARAVAIMDFWDKHTSDRDIVTKKRYTDLDEMRLKLREKQLRSEGDDDGNPLNHFSTKFAFLSYIKKHSDTLSVDSEDWTVDKVVQLLEIIKQDKDLESYKKAHYMRNCVKVSKWEVGKINAYFKRVRYLQNGHNPYLAGLKTDHNEALLLIPSFDYCIGMVAVGNVKDLWIADGYYKSKGLKPLPLFMLVNGKLQPLEEARPILKIQRKVMEFFSSITEVKKPKSGLLFQLDPAMLYKTILGILHLNRVDFLKKITGYPGLYEKENQKHLDVLIRILLIFYGRNDAEIELIKTELGKLGPSHYSLARRIRMRVLARQLLTNKADGLGSLKEVYSQIEDISDPLVLKILQTKRPCLKNALWEKLPQMMTWIQSDDIPIKDKLRVLDTLYWVCRPEGESPEWGNRDFSPYIQGLCQVIQIIQKTSSLHMYSMRNLLAFMMERLRKPLSFKALCSIAESSILPKDKEIYCHYQYTLGSFSQQQKAEIDQLIAGARSSVLPRAPLSHKAKAQKRGRKEDVTEVSPAFKRIGLDPLMGQDSSKEDASKIWNLANAFCTIHIRFVQECVAKASGGSFTKADFEQELYTEGIDIKNELSKDLKDTIYNMLICKELGGDDKMDIDSTTVSGIDSAFHALLGVKNSEEKWESKITRADLKRELLKILDSSEEGTVYALLKDMVQDLATVYPALGAFFGITAGPITKDQVRNYILYGIEGCYARPFCIKELKIIALVFNRGLNIYVPGIIGEDRPFEAFTFNPMGESCVDIRYRNWGYERIERDMPKASKKPEIPLPPVIFSSSPPVFVPYSSIPRGIPAPKVPAVLVRETVHLRSINLVPHDPVLHPKVEVSERPCDFKVRVYKEKLQKWIECLGEVLRTTPPSREKLQALDEAFRAFGVYKIGGNFLNIKKTNSSTNTLIWSGESTKKTSEYVKKTTVADIWSISSHEPSAWKALLENDDYRPYLLGGVWVLLVGSSTDVKAALIPKCRALYAVYTHKERITETELIGLADSLREVPDLILSLQLIDRGIRGCIRNELIEYLIGSISKYEDVEEIKSEAQRLIESIVSQKNKMKETTIEWFLLKLPGCFLTKEIVFNYLEVANGAPGIYTIMKIFDKFLSERDNRESLLKRETVSELIQIERKRGLRALLGEICSRLNDAEARTFYNHIEDIGGGINYIKTLEFAQEEVAVVFMSKIKGLNIKWGDAVWELIKNSKLIKSESFYHGPFYQMLDGFLKGNPMGVESLLRFDIFGFMMGGIPIRALLDSILKIEVLHKLFQHQSDAQRVTFIERCIEKLDVKGGMLKRKRQEDCFECFASFIKKIVADRPSGAVASLGGAAVSAGLAAGAYDAFKTPKIRDFFKRLAEKYSTNDIIKEVHEALG